MARMYQRRGSAAEWSSANPVLAAGEIAVELGDPLKVKVGDGSTAWNDLGYLVPESSPGISAATSWVVGIEDVDYTDGSNQPAPTPGFITVEVEAPATLMVVAGLDLTVPGGELAFPGDVSVGLYAGIGFVAADYGNDLGYDWSNVAGVAASSGFPDNIPPDWYRMWTGRNALMAGLLAYNDKGSSSAPSGVGDLTGDAIPTAVLTSGTYDIGFVFGIAHADAAVQVRNRFVSAWVMG